MRLKKVIRKILLIIFIFLGLFSFFKWQNNSITLSEIEFKNHKVSEEFNGYKILQISDLHNKDFGSNQERILSKVEKIKPDVIVITGDLIDSNNTSISIAMDLIKGASDIAPIIYVSGNHEAWSGSYDILKAQLEALGVEVLDNEKVEVFKGNSSIEFLGLMDPAFSQLDYLEGGDEKGNIQQALETLVQPKDKEGISEYWDRLRILLSHRPELLHTYSESKVDLVFSGHAHGGQFRFPLIGGIIAPDQGIFPKLTEGVHRDNNTTMIISRGLGNSIIPIRIFNRPELIVVTLTR